MPYGRNPKNRESDYTQYLKACILSFPKSDEHTDKEKKNICSETYFSSIKPKSRRKSRRYPSKMRTKRY